MQDRCRATALAVPAFLAALVLVGSSAGRAAADDATRAPSAAPGNPVDSAMARAFVAKVAPDAGLQAFLDRSVATIGAGDPKFLASSARIAVIDLTGPQPRLASVRGDEKVYPASVVKFVYLMAAYAWREQGRLAIDAELDAELSGMIRESSNGDTQKVFAKLTGDGPGPDLDPPAYAAFRERRLVVKKWLATLGIWDLHAVNPTWDGGGDLFGRDVQFLRDRSVQGGLPATGDQYGNRQAMTASGTARLLALLARDLALTPADSATVRQRMRRDVREQPHLIHRIAGGIAALQGEVSPKAGHAASPSTSLQVFSKSGTWGPIYADAGIVRGQDGRQFVLAVFTDASPPYRGDAIAELSRRLAQHLLVEPPPS